MHIYCTYVVTYLHVFARIARICTYFFVWKVARRIDVRIFAHTCIYVQIRTQIRTNTCKYVRKYVQKIKDPVLFQCSYMHLYARICMYMFNMIRLYGHIRPQIVYVRICMYMYVYDVYARTMHVYACIFSYDPLKHGS